MSIPSSGRTGGHAVKIVVTGPFAAGKTTLIQTISETAVLATERDLSDQSSGRKTETTVAMDFGRLTLDVDLVLHLFGTPGQERFDFMWEILGTGMLGFVLLVDATAPRSVPEAKAILAAFGRRTEVPYVVALNRVDGLDADRVASVRNQLALPAAVPVVGCDATDRESVKGVLLALLHRAVELLEATPARAPG